MKKLYFAVVVALFIFFVSGYFFSFEEAKVLGVVTFLVVLWTNEALPLGVVSLLPLILFPSFNILDLNSTAMNYSKSIIFLFLGGFLLAIAMQKSRLSEYIAVKILRLFPKSATAMIYSLSMTSAALSAFLSNTTVTIMLLPVALCLSKNLKLKVRYLLAIAYGASIGGIFTPIGTPPNLILLGFLEDVGLEAPSFIEWMGLTGLIVVAMIAVVPWILSIGVRQEAVEVIEGDYFLSDKQRLLLKIIGVLVALLVINPFLKDIFGFALNEKVLILFFGLLLFLPDISLLKWEDTKEIPYDIIFLFGAGFSIASAFIKSGLAKDIALKLSLFNSYPVVVVIFLIALFVSFSTEITSNTALTSIMLPVVYEFAKNSHFEPQILLFVATVSASYAFMLPIATPPNAVVMSSKVIKISQMAKIGFFINLIGVVLVTFVAVTIWRVYFGS